MATQMVLVKNSSGHKSGESEHEREICRDQGREAGIGEGREGGLGVVSEH